MRSLITLGVVSLVGVAAMFACGDDDSGDGPSNTAGRGGTGGAGGATGGTGGATGGTGGATGGTGGSGGAAPGPEATCEGCVELVAPLTGPNDGADNVARPDQIGYQFVFMTPVDFSDAIVTWSVAALAPNANTFVQLFAQNGQALGYAGAYLSFSLDPDEFPANEFQEIVLDLAAVAAAPGDAGVPDAGEPPVDVVDAGGGDAGDASVTPVNAPTIIGAFDKSQVTQLGITIGVGNTFTGSTVLRVAIDQVDIAGVPGQAQRTFTANAEGLVLNNYVGFPGMLNPFHHP